MVMRIEELVQARNGLEVLETFAAPSGSINNAMFSSNTTDRLASSKAVHQQHISAELAEQNTAVVAIEKLLFIANAAGTLDQFKVATVVAADDATRNVDVDLHKSTSGGAFASVLSADVNFTNTDTALTAKSGTITSASYVAGDIFKVVVAVSGASGNQAKGLIATCVKSENPS